MAPSPVDALALARQLIRCPSVTPEDGGALDTLQAALESLGFTCHRMVFSAPDSPDIDNIYARLGTGAPNLCYAGHTDVVPVGDEAGWTVDPFGGEVKDGLLYGRGATDMKGAIAAFVAAVSAYLSDHPSGPKGSISLLITGDEEGPSINGTVKALDLLRERGETIDDCLVGEPTNPDALGDMIKIGRRGSLTGLLTVTGVQGHTAYPHLADNPMPRLLAVLQRMLAAPLDDGTDHFQPSNIQITTIDTGNPATNVTPAAVRAGFNIRFNDRHTGESLTGWLSGICGELAGDHTLDIQLTGDAFLTPPGPFSDLLAGAVEKVTGRRPELSTSGGTSDARFIKNFCRVAEFGLISQTMHKTDEHIAVADILALSDIYGAVLDGYFAG